MCTTGAPSWRSVRSFRILSGSLTRRLRRRAGRVPVEIYGHGQANVSLTLDAHVLDLALQTPAQVFTLDIEGKNESCLVKEVQYDTFGQQILHVDFARVDLSEEVDGHLVHHDVVDGRIVGRRKSGCTAVSQHAVTKAIKCARYMALMPYVGG